ncbi:MAG: 30S ribosomal protein S5 [Candidatus Methanoperedens sp.]|nr:30S ribosomal protein S5 [Candidatus Methanoperedens sp.]
MRETGFVEEKAEWVPQTRLGKLVKEGQVTTMGEALASGLPIREHQIVDALIPEIRDEVLDINMVQRMTDSGRRVKFRATVIVGNGDGFIGIGEGKDVQVGVAIRKAIDTAKMNIISIKRGCGSWECGCGLGHTVPFEVRGKAGSVEVELKPAPRGLGLASGGTAKKVLEIAGIKDVWTKVYGETRTTINFAKATFDALMKTTTMKV